MNHSAESFYDFAISNNIIIDSEKETGKGRADIVLIPKIGQNNNAIIIEYKIAKKEEDLEQVARVGLEQINNQQYDTKIKEHSHVQEIIKISMAFCGKQVSLQSVFNKMLYLSFC